MHKHKPRCYDSLRDLSSIRGIVPTWLPLHKKESFKTLFFIVYFLWVIQSNKMERGEEPLSILFEQKSVFLTDILIKIFLPAVRHWPAFLASSKPHFSGSGSRAREGPGPSK